MSPSSERGATSRFEKAVPSSTAKRRRWLLGLEPIFEGGWLHNRGRARNWDVESELIARSLFGDVTTNLSDAHSVPTEITITAYAIGRDVDVLVPPRTYVELVGRDANSHLHNDVPVDLEDNHERVVLVEGHTLLGDVTVRVSGAPS